MNLKTIILITATLFLMIACGGKDVNPRETSFEIYLDFWNETGTNPEIRFDELKTDREIKIDFTKTFDGFAQGNSLTNVVIDNFRIVDTRNNNYNINKISAFEYRPDSKAWREDVEFTMDYSQSSNISVVLVLDRSESLGEDFTKIQQYANDFIDRVFSERDEIKMGIVDFADDIKSFPITDNKESLKEYISNLKQGKFTTLYDATNLGINMLKNSDSQSKAIIVFTDGTDNNSSPNVNVDYLINQSAGDTGTPITTFAIGLNGNGGVDKTVLDKLSAHGGSASYPENVEQLKSVFQTFSGLISNVYHLTYLRNQQKIPRNSPVQLKFVINTK